MNNSLVDNLRPDIPGAFFPALPPPYAARLLAVLYQLEQSQWWSAEQLADRQRIQREALVWHAWKTCPGYRCGLQAAGYAPGGPIDDALWTTLPVLTRTELQRNRAALVSTAIPEAHGRAFTIESSGSTGSPVQVLGTDLTRLFWQAGTLRDHLWHRRDLSRSLFSIRPDRGRFEEMVRQQDWGPPVDLLAESGPMWLMHSNADLEEQLRCLCQVRPDYLLTLPSNLRELVHLSAKRGLHPVGLEVRTFGETVDPELRHLVRESWGIPLTDIYSASETGYLALQCPEGKGYHVQAETVLLEVLDQDGRPCNPGGVGRVVLTPLHNFALPLIRYELGDYAEVGDPCPCGRGLPTLARIMGRVRGMAVTPTGRRFWPSFPAETWMSIAPIRQIRLTQISAASIEVTYAMEQVLAAEQEQALRKVLQKTLACEFQLSFKRVDSIPRSANGKYEDFISLVAH